VANPPHSYTAGRSFAFARDENADDNGRVIFQNAAARCTAILRGDLGLIGFFEAMNEPALVQQLLREAAAWLRAQGAQQVIGPMDGDTWHRYRVNAGPFDEPPFLLEPVNPPFYAELWAPFQIVERYSSKRVHDVAGRTARADARARVAARLSHPVVRSRADRG
jgi:hypothetical protein